MEYNRIKKEFIDKDLIQQVDDVTEQLAQIAVNPLDYGAFGNGIADDYQAFVNALAVPNISTLLIPKGRVFRIETDETIQIPPNIEIIGDGEIITNPNRTKALFEINQKQGVRLTRLKIDGQVTPESAYKEHAHSVLIRSSEVIIEGCDIKNIGGDGIYVGRDYYINDLIYSDVIIKNNKIHNCKRNSIAIASCNKATVTQNTITTDLVGIYNISAVIDIEPNNVDDRLTGIKVINNYIKAITASGSVRVLCASGKEPAVFRDITIDGNIIHCVDNPLQAIVHDGAARTATDSLIKNNRIFGAVQNGIYVYACGDGLKIKDNYIDQSSVVGISAAYSKGDIEIENNIVNVSGGRAIRLMNNIGTKYVIKSNIFGGTVSSDAECVMVSGNNTSEDVLLDGNIDKTKGSAHGLRVYQCDKVRAIYNNTEKLTLTYNTNVIDIDNIVGGVYPTKSGITANRPIRAVTGQSYFDTTLNKPIYHNGTAWVDSNGTAV